MHFNKEQINQIIFMKNLIWFLIIILLSSSSCSRSGQRKRMLEKEHSEHVQGSQSIRPLERSTRTSPETQADNRVSMRLQNGVYYIPIKINGIAMEFIFDTGASIISISVTEAMFLAKQGLLRDEDFLGSTFFSDATGTISEGTRINLKSVQIGSKTLSNVEASVVHNLEAPLLLGQSALRRFGKVTIDYQKGELLLE